MSDVVSKVIGAEECAEIVSSSFVMEKLDLGHSFLYKLAHPTYGTIVVLNSSVGASGLIQC